MVFSQNQKLKEEKFNKLKSENRSNNKIFKQKKRYLYVYFAAKMILIRFCIYFMEVYLLFSVA